MNDFQLADLLDRVEPTRPLWVTEDDRELDAGSISERIESLRQSSPRPCSDLVRVEAVTPSSFSEQLVANDGFAESMMLFPPGLSDDVGAQLFAEARAFCGGSKIPSQRTSTAAGHHPTRWVLATSGTTGTPKLVFHRTASLTKTASFDLDIGRQHTWSSLYHLTGFAGLQVFLQAWCGGSRFVMHDESHSLSDRVERMVRHGVTALSATPTMWRKLLMIRGAEKLPLKRITLGGEIADQKILDALADHFPTAKIRQIYASTEAGVGFSVRDGKAGFPKHYLTSPPRGVRIAVREGRLWIKSTGESATFAHDRDAVTDNSGFLDTGDRVAEAGERFEFLGRSNGAINVGGNKVQPEEVEQVLLAIDGIRAVRVYAKKSPFTGSLVAADVVCDGEAANRRKQILEHCRMTLPTYKVPALVRIVDQIPTNATGKVVREAA